MRMNSKKYPETLSGFSFLSLSQDIHQKSIDIYVTERFCGSRLSFTV